MIYDKAKIIRFPDELKGVELEMGIDEAGRGPVLGSMVYCGSIAKLGYKWPKEIDDSKKLTPEKRSEYLKKLMELPVGFVVRILSAEEIDGKRLRPRSINLNELSHNAAFEMVQTFLDAGAKIRKIFVDTVGPADKYEDKFNNAFRKHGVIVKVSQKADSLFKCVGAASICAKVTRDNILSSFNFVEKGVNCDQEFGSGYPGDPITVSWLKKNLHPFFGFPSVVRFSWETVDKQLKEYDLLKFEEDLGKDEFPAKTDSHFFVERNLQNFSFKSKKQKPTT